MEKSRRCDICGIDVHRISYAKHLRSTNHSENIRQVDMITPDSIFKEPNENYKKIHNPKPLKQIARYKIKQYDKQLNKELAEKMTNPYYFQTEH